PDQRGFVDLAWAGLMRTLDAGTMGGDTGSWPFLLAMLVTTMGGIFLVSTLIGVLTTGIEGKLDELRKGRSFVAESGHTVILGWSPQIFTLISELVTANLSLPRSCIVILAEQDAAEMQDEIWAKLGNTKKTRIVCRTGLPMDNDDLRLVNPEDARAIIILPPEEGNGDAYVIKTMLALVGHPKRPARPYHVVTYIRATKNLEVAQMVGDKEVEVIAANDLIARLTAQTCRQSGLSVAYTELLNFDGDEIYFKAEPALVGKTFGDTLMAFEDSTVIGLSSPTDGIRLNPPMDQRLASGDQLIFIAADENAIRLSQTAPAQVDSTALRHAPPRQAGPERTLILGWNERAAAIIGELDYYVGSDSEVQLVATPDPNLAEFLSTLESQRYRNLRVSVQNGDITERRTLEALAIPTFQHVIVLSEWCEGMDNIQQVDARTLITLLHLRKIAEAHGHPFSIVSEMLDVRNRELAQVTRADD
ncbi:MAG TPA: hypothetical protein PKE45_03500, partial [Caldilineaceae bacterium]|nr:hypothetical protein [Caldilineaceae bacterium]